MAKFWRVNVTANNNSNWRAAHFTECHFQIGGVKQTGTYSGSKPYGPAPFSYGNDDNFGTTYTSNGGQGLPAYYAVEFPDSRVIDAVGIAPDWSEGNGSYAPRDFTIDYSDDGVTWATAIAYSGIQTASYQNQVLQQFPVPAPSLEADARVDSVAVIVVTGEDAPSSGGAQVGTAALIAIVGETPPLAGGARLDSAVIIAITVEYELPVQYNPISLKPVFAFPLLIGGDY